MLSEIKILTRLKQWKGDKSNPVPVCGQRVDETKAHRISFPFMLGHFHMSPLLSCPSITFYSGQDSCLGLKHIHSSAVHQIAPNTVILQSSWRREWRGGRHKVSRRQSCVGEPSYFNPLNTPRLMMWSLYVWRTTSGKRPNVISCQSASDCVNAEVRARSRNNSCAPYERRKAQRLCRESMCLCTWHLGKLCRTHNLVLNRLEVLLLVIWLC